MRDYSELVNTNICWKSNEEVNEFDRTYKPMILGVLRKKNVEESSCFTLYNDILIKFGRGKLNYNDKIGKFETFLYQIAENAAKDYFREHNRIYTRQVDITDQNTATLYDFSNESQEKFEHYKEIAVETLKRICLKNKKNLQNVELFARRCFSNEDIELLAEDYGKNKNEVSLIASRMRKKYMKIFAEVEQELSREKMVQTNISIDFLEPFVDFSFSA